MQNENWEWEDQAYLEVTFVRLSVFCLDEAPVISFSMSEVFFFSNEEMHANYDEFMFWPKLSFHEVEENRNFISLDMIFASSNLADFWFQALIREYVARCNLTYVHFYFLQIIYFDILHMLFTKRTIRKPHKDIHLVFHSILFSTFKQNTSFWKILFVIT